jgi:response regulator RpfG family c-di-GMP phosphodiesterase
MNDKILIVDDTPASLRLLSNILSAGGYQVLPAISGELALIAANKNRPDLILLDICMPEMDGFEVCRRLRAQTLDMPVIFVSALAETTDKVKGFELGGVDFVSKPYQRDELLARVRTHLELNQLRHHLEERVAARNAELKDSEVQIQRLNRTLRTVSICNQDLVRARNEEDLLNAICRHIVKTGGYQLACVAYPAEHTGLCSIAHFGNETMFQHHEELASKSDYASHCQMLIAQQERRTTLCNHLDECRLEFPVDADIKSVLALPLLNNEHLLGVLAAYSSTRDNFDAREIQLMEELAADLAYGIDALRTTLERNRAQLQLGHALTNTVNAMAKMLEMRDPYTAGHQQRVAELSVAIGHELGLDENRIAGLKFGSMIHDIGKIGVPAEYLAKPGQLCEIERKLIQMHPQIGSDIVKDIEFSWPVAQMIRQHHERMDGTGYPDGLKGDDIIFEARIIAVADVIEAMSSHRPYRPTLGIAAAVDEIKLGSGHYYDSTVVEACLRLQGKGFVFSRN